MQLQEILDVQTIKVGMNNPNKDSIIKELAQDLKGKGYLNNIEVFLTDVYKRESEGATGIGNYVAIPHGKSSAVTKVGVAIGVLDHEIQWETLDGNGVKVVILFSVGNDVEGAKTHLKLLSNFARKLGNDEVVANLIKSTSVQEVIDSFIGENS